ncbi:MAG: methylamine dehydrogenase accessory protein MauD [Halieaceae bacterium]|jgi:methylamine dehydrogenase accessory protein MauD
MDWLVVSNIALWIGFVLLAVINLALLRQVGVLYERVAPAGALMVNQVQEVGNEAPPLSLQTITGTIEEIGGVRDGKSQLLFFVSPDCPVCGELTAVFKSAAAAESSWLHAVVASDGNEHDHPGYVARKGLESFPYVVSEILGKTYGVSKLPYAVLIDEQGKIASLGIVNSREHLESLFEAKERKVASIQEYMNKKTAVNYVEADKA